MELQAKLLRVLQDGEFERLGSSHTIKVDVRIIAATNRNLKEEVRKGTFREDLWYRLNVFPIIIPPLRDRLDDVPLLMAFYIKRIAKRTGKNIEIIPENIMDTLKGCINESPDYGSGGKSPYPRGACLDEMEGERQGQCLGDSGS